MLHTAETKASTLSAAEIVFQRSHSGKGRRCWQTVVLSSLHTFREKLHSKSSAMFHPQELDDESLRTTDYCRGVRREVLVCGSRSQNLLELQHERQ
ncbi:hypothetical protein NPIL_34051 [Nephila pilipes]|uniref:Uncharacterized protein n=1 Tax=Nephila pilipes TaxID=299642 RepID=A0A8X6P2F3_NEPPI|nr:hypothetical protein NPIL_34051 [Nephila pilipes]